MKTHQLVPIAAAALGFTIAWVAKPTPEPSAPAEAAGKPSTNKITRNERSRTRSESVAGKRPTEVNPGDFPLADLHENSPKTRSEAKLLRLTEALDLSIEQQGEIIKAVEDAKAAAKDGVSIIEDLAIRGKQVEEALTKVLSPDQFAKFQEIRARERDNRIEIQAQRALSQVINEIDLSPGQRDAALARLRQAEKEKLQEIPAAATLLLKSSMLSTDANGMTMEGLLAFNQISSPNASPDNLEAAHQQMVLRQKQKLENKLRCFDGILSPGQMGQYNAILNEQKALLDRVPPVPQPPQQR